MRSAAGKRLRVARSWQEELAQIPADGFAVRGAWLRNRVLTDGFRKSERLIYERSLRNDVDVARLWKPPAPPRPALAGAAALGVAGALALPVYLLLVFGRAGQESEIPNFKGSYLGRFPLDLTDFWTSDHLSERSRSMDAFSGTRARGTLMLKRT